MPLPELIERLGVGIQGDWLNMDTASGTLDSSGCGCPDYINRPATCPRSLPVTVRRACRRAPPDRRPPGSP